MHKGVFRETDCRTGCIEHPVAAMILVATGSHDRVNRRGFFEVLGLWSLLGLKSLLVLWSLKPLTNDFGSLAARLPDTAPADFLGTSFAEAYTANCFGG
jgi:hypothetical protein